MPMDWSQFGGSMGGGGGSAAPVSSSASSPISFVHGETGNQTLWIMAGLALVAILALVLIRK
jgi:hypothetical protein